MPFSYTFTQTEAQLSYTATKLRQQYIANTPGSSTYSIDSSSEYTQSKKSVANHHHLKESHIGVRFTNRCGLEKHLAMAHHDKHLEVKEGRILPCQHLFLVRYPRTRLLYR
jgi:hypothetical protein